MPEDRTFSQLVVVGSSAGGIEALSRLISALPQDFPAPVVIAQHMHPERESHLEDILSRENRLPVRTVTDKGGAEPLEASTVFVVPADKNVSITDSEIRLHEDGQGRPKPSIDLLMSSAAGVYGESLFAVILSGTGTDGTDGARAVKAYGGTVIVQNPESAEFSGMPGSLAPSTVDIVSDLDGIGPILADLLSESGVSEESTRADGEETLPEFLEELRESHSVDFSEYKRPTIRRRLARRFAATGVGDLAEYRRYLRENPDEYRKLINSFLIKVTEFFRDPEQFEHLRNEVLPRIVERARESGEQIRVWSAGCATGEEAYSLAILLSDAVAAAGGEVPDGLDVRIFATDLDEGAVDYARRGVYPASALSALSEEQVSRYFEQTDGLYYVTGTLRSMIIFGEHDLAQRSPFPRLDLVVSRNVLIYFTQELQRRTLQLFAFSLKDDGYLMLGASESANQLSEYLTPVDRNKKLFRRQGERFVMPVSSLVDPVPHPPRGPAHGRRSLHLPQSSGSRSRGRGKSQGMQGAGSSGEPLLDLVPVGLVTVDESYDIRSLNVAARRLLSIHGTAVGEDLLHLIREAPYDELRPAIDSALRDRRVSSTGEFDVEEVTTGETRTLRMTCHPPEGDPADAAAMQTVAISVENVTESSRARRELEERLDFLEAEVDRLRQDNEKESERRREQNARLVEGNSQLEEANRELRRIVEELGYSNEQYQISIEEAQASAEEVETLNEEMQATNEELETVNEELQATVEELNTTNENLQARSAELQEVSRAREREQKQMRRQLQTQLQTLLESVPEPMIVVEPSGQDTLTNEAYRRIFGSDGFKVLDDASHGLPEAETPQDRVTQGESFVTELRATDVEGVRRRYEVTGNPVGDEHQRGGLVVFREIPGDAAQGKESGD